MAEQRKASGKEAKLVHLLDVWAELEEIARMVPHAPQEHVDRLVWAATEKALALHTNSNTKGT